VIIGPTHKIFFLLGEIILRTSIRTSEAEKDRKNKHIQPKFVLIKKTCNIEYIEFKFYFIFPLGKTQFIPMLNTGNEI